MDNEFYYKETIEQQMFVVEFEDHGSPPTTRRVEQTAKTPKDAADIVLCLAIRAQLVNKRAPGTEHNWVNLTVSLQKADCIWNNVPPESIARKREQAVKTRYYRGFISSDGYVWLEEGRVPTPAETKLAEQNAKAEEEAPFPGIGGIVAHRIAGKTSQFTSTKWKDGELQSLLATIGSHLHDDLYLSHHPKELCQMIKELLTLRRTLRIVLPRATTWEATYNLVNKDDPEEQTKHMENLMLLELCKELIKDE